MAHRARQLAFVIRTHGGARRGAGRKRVAPRPGVPHRSRAPHHRHHPVHVTLRAGALPASLRAAAVFPAVRGALARASREAFRVLAFSIQADHVHLVVEAESTHRLTRGLQGLAIRVARAVNRVLGRRGVVWSDRYHARALTTPRAVRHALVYVFAQLEEAPARRTRARSLLVGRVVLRMADSDATGCRVVTGGGCKNVARSVGMAPARIDRRERGTAAHRTRTGVTGRALKPPSKDRTAAGARTDARSPRITPPADRVCASEGNRVVSASTTGWSTHRASAGRASGCRAPGCQGAAAWLRRRA